jgi:4-amino-4-deoxy-L-arabinose transferase-like glycosyltransferase
MKHTAHFPHSVTASQIIQRGTLPRFLITLLFFVSVSGAIQLYTGGYGADRGNHSDEAAHFVSSLVIADYIATGHWSNPVKFATDYYAHFPKVAIGHWPPVFELLLALLFLIFGHPGTVALLLQAIIAGVATAIPAWIVGRSLGVIPGLLAGAMVLCAPVFLPMLNMAMADNLLAVTVVLTAICWSRFYHGKNWRWGILFAGAAAAAILTKGTAFGLAFMPLIYLAIKRDFKFLLNVKTIAAGCLVGVLTLPWYVLTYKMAADGWVYTWGIAYSKLAIPFFAGALVTCIGVPGVLAYMAGIGLYAGRKQTNDQTVQQLDIAAFVAASLAMILFAMVAPADLDPRYLIAALPCIAVVTVWGAAQCIGMILRRPPPALPVSAGVAALMLVSLLLVFQPPATRSFHTAQLVDKIVAAHELNPFILVSGNVFAEGAFIASFAERDPAKRYYVVRAQKALASTNWMASSYTLKFTTPSEMAQWIKDNAIGWIAIDTDAAHPEFPHNALLKNVLDNGLLSARLVDTVTHGSGMMQLYALPAVSATPAMSDSLRAALAPGHLGDRSQ